MARRRLVCGLCLLAVIAATAYAKYLWMRTHGAASGAIARLGKPLPPLVVFDSAGQAVDLSKAATGSRCVIAFYSSSCRLCRETLPLLQPFPAELRLYLVERRREGNPDGAIAPELEGSLMFSDRNDVLSRSFPLSGVPTILFVDERGVLRDGLVGKRAAYRLREKLQAFVELNP